MLHSLPTTQLSSLGTALAGCCVHLRGAHAALCAAQSQRRQHLHLLLLRRVVEVLDLKHVQLAAQVRAPRLQAPGQPLPRLPER